MNPKFHTDLIPTNMFYYFFFIFSQQYLLKYSLVYTWAVSILYPLELIYILHFLQNFILIFYI